MAWKLYAIEQMPLRGRRRVDGVGCPIFDFHTGRPADKIILISWIPDTSPVMKKMKYAGTKEAVKSALQGIAINLNLSIGCCNLDAAI